MISKMYTSNVTMAMDFEPKYESTVFLDIRRALSK